jgi:hypothetical protein
MAEKQRYQCNIVDRGITSLGSVILKILKIFITSFGSHPSGLSGQKKVFSSPLALTMNP